MILVPQRHLHGIIYVSIVCPLCEIRPLDVQKNQFCTYMCAYLNGTKWVMKKRQVHQGYTWIEGVNEIDTAVTHDFEKPETQN